MASKEGARGALRVLGKVLHGILRAAGWLFLIVVLTAAAVGAYVYRRFKPEDARRLAEQQLSALLHREVTIQRLVLAPHGVKIVGLRVRRGRPGEGDLLSCDSALVTLKLRPLVERRRLELDSIVLQSPQILLERDEQGSWDLADVFMSSGATAAAPLPIAMAAAETDVEDGVLRVDDRLRGRKFSFDRLKLRVTSFDVDRAFPVRASFAMSDAFGGRTVTAEVDAEGRVDLASLHWSSAAATADRFAVRVGGVEVSGRGSATGFPAAHIDAQFTVPPLGPAQWSGLLGRDYALSAPPSSWKVKAFLPAAGMVDLERADVETPAGTGSATGLFDFGADTPTLSVELAAHDVDLAQAGKWHPDWAAHALAGTGSLRASVTGWPGRLQARDADLTLRGFGGAWGKRSIAGAEVYASASDEFSRVKVAVGKGKVGAFGNVFDDVALALSVEKQNLSVDRLTFKWGGSSAHLRARVDHLSAPKEVVLSGGVDKVDWESAARLVADVRAAISTRTAAFDGSQPWLRTFKYSIPHGFPDSSGHIRVGEVTQANFNCKDVDFMWSVKGVTPTLEKLSGEARLAFGPGRVADIAAVQSANGFLRVVFLPFIYMYKMNQLSVFSGNTAYPKSLDFARIDGEYGASKGVAAIRYFHVNSPELVVFSEGYADLGHERVDMNVLTRLTSYRGQLPEWWGDVLGRPAIGFRVKGDINRPDLEPRFNKIGATEIEDRVEGARALAKKRFLALERLQTL